MDIKPKRILSEEILIGKVSPQETLSGKTLSEREVPGKGLSKETLMEMTLSKKKLPGKELSEETILGKELSGEELPGKELPGKALLGKGLFLEELPDKALLEETLSEEKSQEETLSKKVYFEAAFHGKTEKIGLEALEVLLPDEIEKRSFEIISRELEEQNLRLKPEQEMVIKRVIHTSADFDYAATLTFSEGAVERAKELIREGADIVTDTNMALAGINKNVLARYGGKAHCFMAEKEVAEMARERQTTRAAVSMEVASGLDKPVIFAVGNAPTALIQLHEMLIKKQYRPAFIIGVPVGFVNVVAAKELIMDTDIPHIVNRGRKGGSNVAAAICNAILYELGR